MTINQNDMLFGFLGSMSLQFKLYIPSLCRKKAIGTLGYPIASKLED